MKKSVLALAMAFGVSSAFAQDLTSKKGEPILPEAGDWAISTDATPFLNYAGNFFGKSANNTAPTFDFLGSHNVIMGKYFKDEKTAYRGALNIGFGTQSFANNVQQDHLGTPTPGTIPAQVTDKQSISNTGIGLSVGMEKRKGKTRLQGYYGAEFFLFIGSTHQKNTYGNSFSDSTGTVTSTSQYVSGNAATAGTSYAGTTVAAGTSVGSGRVTDVKSNGSLQIGVRGFIGVEYFIIPKMSLGGEFGWGIGFQSWGATKTTYESSYQKTGAPVATSWSSATNVVTTPGKASAFTVGTDNKNSAFGPTGSLRLNFYF